VLLLNSKVAVLLWGSFAILRQGVRSDIDCLSPNQRLTYNYWACYALIPRLGCLHNVRTNLTIKHRMFVQLFTRSVQQINTDPLIDTPMTSRWRQQEKTPWRFRQEVRRCHL